MLGQIKLSSKLIFLGIVLLGAILRLYHFGQFPIAGETLDEYAWSTLGASLIQQHYPASWSAFSAYQGRTTGYFYRNWPVVTPALDHPPLFALIPGLFHGLTTDWFQLPSIQAIRFPLVGLGVLNLVLFCAVMTKWLGKPWSYLAGLIYATVPLVVFSSRLVLAENLLQTFLLLFLLVTQTKWRRMTPWLLIILSALAVLTKVSGLVLPLAVMSWYLWQKNYRSSLYLLFGIGLGLLTWLAYAVSIDIHLFWQVQVEQGARDIGLTTLFNRWLLHPTLIRNYYFDGWWWLGWLGFVATLFQTASQKLKTWPAVMTLSVAFLVWHSLFIMTSVGESTFHGWYDYTIMPLIIGFAIYFIQMIWRQKLFLAWWLIWLCLLASLRWAISFFVALPEVSSLWLRLLISLGLLPFVLSQLPKRQSFAQAAAIILLALVVTANLITIIHINDRVYSEFDTYFLPHRFN